MKKKAAIPFKIMQEQVGMQDGSPLKVKYCDYEYFRYPLHQHGELEIIYITESTGTRYIGNNVERYAPGDIVLVGSFLPHMYKSDTEYYTKENKGRVRAIIVQFAMDFARSTFFAYPELKKIATLLHDAANGIAFPPPDSDTIAKKMQEILHKKGSDRIFKFLRILDIMSRCKKRKLLNTTFGEQIIYEQEDSRITRILSHLNRSYTEKVTLCELSKIACMNESALCRFFKIKTGKTIIQYVNELRIAYACKLLTDGTLSIAEIGYHTGFNNISAFNRIFKRVIGLTPTGYKEQYGMIGIGKHIEF